MFLVAPPAARAEATFMEWTVTARTTAEAYDQHGGSDDCDSTAAYSGVVSEELLGEATAGYGYGSAYVDIWAASDAHHVEADVCAGGTGS